MLQIVDYICDQIIILIFSFIHIHKHTLTHTHGQAQTDSQAGKQADKQAGKQTHSHKKCTNSGQNCAHRANTMDEVEKMQELPMEN